MGRRRARLAWAVAAPRAAALFALVAVSLSAIARHRGRHRTEREAPQGSSQRASAAPHAMASYLLEIVAAIVASYLLTPAAAFTWLRQVTPRPAAVQQRSSALARSQGGFQAILRAASTTTCPDCDLCADPFCGCAMCAASGTVLKKHSLPCGCESVCLCPGGFANAVHAPGCQCDQCSH